MKRPVEYYAEKLIKYTERYGRYGNVIIQPSIYKKIYSLSQYPKASNVDWDSVVQEIKDYYNSGGLNDSRIRNALYAFLDAVNEEVRI